MADLAANVPVAGDEHQTSQHAQSHISSTNIPPRSSDHDLSESHQTFNFHIQLDAAWEKYLSLLDEYTTAQVAIQKSMSAGLFSLAQANFKSSGRRYGKDYYDQRAVATVRVEWKVENEGDGGEDDVGKDDEASDEFVNGKGNDGCVRMRIGIVKHHIPKSETSDEEKVSEDLSANFSQTTISSTSSEVAEKEAEPSAEPASNPDPNQDSDKTAKAYNPASKPNTELQDPIRQFGILVPPTLRTAQKSFTSAVLDENCVAKAVEAARGMRRVEAEIWKWRKEIRKMEKRGEVGAGCWYRR